MRYDALTGTFYVLYKSLLTAAGAVRFVKAPGKGLCIDHSSARTRYPFVFVHGFFGWGQNEMKTPRLIQFNYSSAGQPRGYISVKRVHFAGRVKPGCFCYMEVAA